MLSVTVLKVQGGSGAEPSHQATASTSMGWVAPTWAQLGNLHPGSPMKLLTGPAFHQYVDPFSNKAAGSPRLRVCER